MLVMQKNWIIGITAVGALLRFVLGLSTLLHPSPELNAIQADHFMTAATYLLHNGDIPDPVFVPGYIYLCAFLEFIFSTHAIAALLLLQWMMATMCIPMAIYLANELDGPLCGLVCGALVALDPLLLIQSSLVLTEAIYIPLLLAAVFLFVNALTVGNAARKAFIRLGLCGLVVGICTLTRSVGLFVLPVMLLTLVMSRPRPWSFRAAACAILTAPVIILLMPLCLHNQAKHGHFNISSSAKFNTAALVVGPTKKAFDKNQSPELLGMWTQELGNGYLQMPPFVLADKASKVAVAWAEEHPLLTVQGILKGQLLMLVAPERTSWAAGLAWLNLPAKVLRGAYVVISLVRLSIALVVVWGVCYFRHLFRDTTLLLFFLLLVLCHMAGAGAVGAGRFVAPVVPYIDLIASLTLVRIIIKTDAIDHIESRFFAGRPKV